MTPVEERIDHELRRLFEPSSGFVDWALADDDPNDAWSTPRHAGRLMVKRLRALLTEHSAREETIQQAEAALRWNMEYAGKMVWMCPSFVYVERESRAAIDLLRSRAAK